MNDTIAVARSPKEILREALDTIVATYWVRSREFVSLAEGIEADGHYKKVPAGGDIFDDVFYEGERRMIKVSHVCSIGAITLANAALYDRPLTGYAEMAGRDPITRAAGIALANHLVLVSANVSDPTRQPESGIIVNWNDQSDRTREEVVAAFEAALDSELLDVEEIWGIGYRSGEQHLPVWFASEAAAGAFFERLKALHASIEGWGNPLVERLPDLADEEFLVKKMAGWAWRYYGSQFPDFFAPKVVLKVEDPLLASV